MFSRQCIKFSSSARFFYKKPPFHKKYVLPSCICQLQQPRSLSASSPLPATEKKLSVTSTPPAIDNKQIKNEARLPKTQDSPSKISDLNSKNAEDLLEKLMASLSSDIHQKNRIYKNDLMRIIGKVKELNFSTKKQGLLLLRCCTELLPDESPMSRMAIVEQVWNALKPHTKFELEHYNELLRVYIANNRTLTVSSFINQMSPLKPTIHTYELILRALGEAGDLNQSTEVISNMKAQGIPATESIFNSLVLAQGKSGNLKNIGEVLTMMKSLKIEISIDTYTATIRALIWNKQTSLILEEMHKARQSGLEWTEAHIMEIVKTLAFMNLYAPVPDVLKFLPEEILKSPSISPYMQSVTTLLVFQNHPIVALEIYKCLPLPSFGPKDDQGLHGRSLVRDCVKASMPSSIIGLVTQELMSTGRNPIAIQNASEAALQLGKIPLALDLFTRMQQLGMPLRPHYFWPVLLHGSKTYGDKGVMNALTTMVTMDVKPDYDTIMDYVLPHVSFTSPQNLMKKFLDTGLSVTTVLTPMTETLLNTGQVRAASEICELFHGKLDADKLLKPLIKGYLISFDVKSTVFLLEDISKKASDNNKDWIGRFLCMFMQNKRVKEDLSDFMKLMKTIAESHLKISAQTADYCIAHLPEKYNKETSEVFRNALIDITDERRVDDAEMFVHHMPHPKQMDESSLQAHLAELEAKGMNTRGVLRKLLQQHCKNNNLAAAREIAEKCQKEGVVLSAGMKAAIFDLHVKMGELDLAEMSLADLNKTSPNFTLDEYKVIDFATLMVYRGQIKKAFDLITEQSKKRQILGGRSIAMNCWRLLDATASKGRHSECKKMLELLTGLRYCKPNNALLGPLVRVHLINGNLHEAVQEYVRLSKKYNKTPLKHELLCKILQCMSDGQSEEIFLSNEKNNGRLNSLAQTVLSVDKNVHGAGDVQLTLIGALADVGFKKTLRKLFLDPSVKFHPDALLRRCERFADEKKLHALENIAECARGLRHVDMVEIYDMILDVHQRDDNYTEAYALWNRMQEADITPSQKFIRHLCSIIKGNNQSVPPELSSLLDKEIAKVTNK